MNNLGLIKSVYYFVNHKVILDDQQKNRQTTFINP